MAGRTQVHRIDVTARDTASPTLERGARSVAASQRALRSSLSATEAASRAADRSIARYGRTAGQSASGARSADQANRALDRSLERLVGSSARAARAHRQQASAASHAHREVTQLAAATRRTMGMAFGGAGLAFGGAMVVRTAGAYQTALRDAGAMAELSGKKLENLGRVSRTVGLNQAVGAKAAAAAAGELAKAGVKYEDVVTGALKSTVDLARAGGVEVPLAADAMSAALGNFGLAGTNAAHVADVLASSSLSTRDSVEGVVRAMSMGSAAAAEVGYSFESTVSAFTLIAQAGTLGARAGTTLRSALLRLVKPPKDAQETIEKYGLSLKNSNGGLKETAELSEELRKKLGGLSDAQQGAALKSLGGTYGMIALSAIMRKSGPEVEALEKRLNRQGVAAKIAAERTTQYQGAIDGLKSAGQEASIVVGGPLLTGIAAAARSSVQVMKSPAVRSALDRFGRQLGDKGKQIAEGFDRAAADGRLAGTLDDALAATDAMVDAASAVAGAVGKIASLWQEVPEGIRSSGVQALIFAAILKRVIGLGAAIPFVGAAAAGSASAAGAGPAAIIAAGGARSARAGNRATGMGPARGALGVRQNTPVGPAAPIYANARAVPPAEARAAMAQANAQRAAAAQAARVASAQARVTQSAALRAEAQAATARRRALATATVGSPAMAGLTGRAASAADARGAAGASSAPFAQRAAQAARIQAEQARAAANAQSTAAASARRASTMAAAAQREAAAQQRAARTAAARSRLPSGKATAGVAAIGVGAAALSGGNVLTSAATGAMVGSMLGPMGIAGGALAGAAGAGLVKYFQKEGKEAARKLGQEIAKGTGFDNGKAGSNLKPAESKELVRLRKENRDLRRAEEMPIKAPTVKLPGFLGKLFGQDTGPAPSVLRGQQVANDRTAGLVQGGAAGRELQSYKFVGTEEAISKISRQFRSLGPEGKKAGLESMAALIAGMEAKGQLADGATQRIMDRLRNKWGHSGREAGVQYAASLAGAVAKAKVDLRFQTTSSKQFDGAKKQIDEVGKKYLGLAPKVKVGFLNVKEVGWQQVRDLGKLAEKASGDTRKAILRDQKTLADALVGYGTAAKPAFKDLEKAFKSALDGVREQLGVFVTDLRSNSGVVNELLSGFTTAGPAAAQPGDSSFVGPVRERRRGGGEVRRRFNGGGVAVAASPGELMAFPDGSYAEVPGHRTAADNVFMTVPDRTRFYTDHGQDLLAAGYSEQAALAYQRPHFRDGGEAQRFASGGTAGKIGPARSAQAHRNAGFRGTPLVNITAISGAESGYDASAVGPVNDDGSRDYGLDQINKRWHPQFFKDPNRIFDPNYNAKASWSISKRGTDFSPWATWPTKARNYLDQARAAVLKSRGGAGEFGDKTFNAPLMLGKSKAGRGELVGGSFASGLALGQTGYSNSDLRKFGNPILKSVGEALGSGKYTREVTAKGGGSDASTTSTTEVGNAGTSPFGGHQVANWMLPSLRFSKKHGWSGAVSSGFRTNAEQKVLYARYLAGGNLAAKPGQSNHEGSRFPRGAIDTPDWQGLRRGLSIYRGSPKPKWFGAGDTVHFSGNGHRRGGIAGVRNFRTGGVVGGVARRLKTGGEVVKSPYKHGGPAGMVGDVNMSAVLYLGGGHGRYEKLALAADETAYKRVERTIGKLRKIADAGGDSKVVARARASMSILENALGLRVGRMLAAGSKSLTRRDDMSEAVTTWQQIRGVDPASVKGLKEQRSPLEKFLADAPRTEKDLKVAVDRARRGDLRSKDGKANLELAEKELQAFQKETYKTRGTLAELGRAQIEAAAVAREATTANATSAAALTASMVDDAAAKRGEAADARMRAAEATDSTTRTGFEISARAADREAFDIDRGARMQTWERAAAEAGLTKSLDDDIAAAAGKVSELERQAADERAKEAAGDPMAKVTEALQALAAGQAEQTALIQQGQAEAQAGVEAQLEIEREKNRINEAKISSMSADARAAASWMSGMQGQRVRGLVSSGSRDPYGRSKR